MVMCTLLPGEKVQQAALASRTLTGTGTFGLVERHLVRLHM